MVGYSFLADAVVVLHFLYVSFTVGGMLAVVAGGVLRWRWVRNLPFRVAHLASVVLVAVEAAAGAACPLTTWEYRLRRAAGQQVEAQISFVARLVRRLIFYDFPSWVFLVTYVAFAAAVILTFILLPPGRLPSTRPAHLPRERRSAPPGTPRGAGRRRPRTPG